MKKTENRNKKTLYDPITEMMVMKYAIPRNYGIRIRKNDVSGKL